MNKLYTACFVFFVGLQIVNAQKKVTTIEGRDIYILKYTLNKEYKEFNYITQKGKDRVLDLEDVFAVDMGSGDSIIYIQDSTIGNDLTVEQMRQYVAGAKEVHLKYSYNKWFYIIGGGLAGFASPVAFKLTDQELFWSPFVPAGLVFVVNILPVKDRAVNRYCSHPNRTTHHSWGAMAMIRKKRFLNTLLGVGVGFGTGLMAASMIN